MSDHDSADDHEHAVQRGGDEEELASKTLMIQSKRFYVDVKQNQRGRFIKIAEVGPGGKKSRLLLPMSTAAELRNHLTEFSDHYASLGPSSAPPPSTSTVNDRGPRDDTVLKSVMLVKDNRRYYLDLKENKRGRFLRVSMTLPLSRQRPQVVIPAQGMIEMRDALTDLLKEFGTDDGDSGVALPEPMSMRVENKTFYFDVGQNKRGMFMRISEVRPNLRTAITLPMQSWAKFRDMMSEFIDNSKKSSDESVVDGPVAVETKAVVDTKPIAETKPVVNGEAKAANDSSNDVVAATEPVTAASN